jgi:hypothetical protein
MTKLLSALLLCLLVGSDAPQCSDHEPGVFTYTHPILPVYHRISDDQVWAVTIKMPICSRHQNHWEGIPRDV